MGQTHMALVCSSSFNGNKVFFGLFFVSVLFFCFVLGFLYQKITLVCMLTFACLDEWSVDVSSGWLLDDNLILHFLVVPDRLELISDSYKLFSDS